MLLRYVARFLHFTTIMFLPVFHPNLTNSSSVHRLDVGNGKRMDLAACPRWRLEQQCIKYLGPVSSYKSLQKCLIEVTSKKLYAAEVMIMSTTNMFDKFKSLCRLILCLIKPEKEGTLSSFQLPSRRSYFGCWEAKSES